MTPVRNETGKGYLEAVDNCHLSKIPKYCLIITRSDNRRQEQAVIDPVWCQFSLFRFVDEVKLFVLKAILSFQ